MEWISNSRSKTKRHVTKGCCPINMPAKKEFSIDKIRISTCINVSDSVYHSRWNLNVCRMSTFIYVIYPNLTWSSSMSYVQSRSQHQMKLLANAVNLDIKIWQMNLTRTFSILHGTSITSQASNRLFCVKCQPVIEKLRH